jgi:hypothetical protein
VQMREGVGTVRVKQEVRRAAGGEKRGSSFVQSMANGSRSLLEALSAR